MSWIHVGVDFLDGRESVVIDGLMCEERDSYGSDDEADAQLRWNYNGAYHPDDCRLVNEPIRRSVYKDSSYGFKRPWRGSMVVGGSRLLR